MQRKILYLVNPVSGVKKKSSLIELIIKKNKEKQLNFDIIQTSAGGDYDFLKQKIHEEEITDIVVCGGDGTMNSIAAALTGTAVNIGIIPSGSGNGLALAAQIPTQPSKALDLIFKGNAAYIDAFYINDQFSCMLCGIGFDGLVAHEFAKQKRRGLQTYIKVSLTNFFKSKPYAFELKHDGKTFSVQAFLISIANGNQFGNNFTIAPKARLNDGLLDIVVIKKMNKFMLPFSVLRQVTGINGIQDMREYSEKRNIIYFQTAALTITNTENALLHIDGEPKDTNRQLNIRVVRNALKLIQP
jgi:diacylglycerol kinase (ATP)